MSRSRPGARNGATKQCAVWGDDMFMITQAYSLDPRQAEKIRLLIIKLVHNPKGLPNGKNGRKRLNPLKSRRLKDGLMWATQQAAIFGAHGTTLPNRLPGRGAPPDNAKAIFIEDIVSACEAVGLAPGLRYVDGTESFPVRVYKALAPKVWPGKVTAPRRLFERWQKVIHPNIVKA